MQDQGRRDHSIVGASGFDRWSVCPGSVQLQVDAEGLGYQSSSDFAREGTVAHEIAADCVENDRDSWEWIGEEVPLTKDGIFDVWRIEPEMAEAVQTWIDTIRADIAEYRKETGHNPEFMVEVKFDLSDLRPGMFGTSDIVMFMPQWNMVRVYDYKHGIGIPVDAYRNGQLMYYAAGAMHYLGGRGAQIDTVELVVVQPRNFHGMGPVRRWHASLQELVEWVDQELLPAVDRTQDPNAALVPGDHCRFCPAKMICPALQDQYQEFVEMAERSAKALSDEDVADLLAKKPAVQHFIKALDDDAFNRMVQGQKIPGFKLVRKQSRRAWMEGAEEALKQKAGDAAFATELKTPAQVEKLSGMKDLVQDWSHKPDTGRTLAPESDSRPSMTPVTPQEAFAHLT